MPEIDCYTEEFTYLSGLSILRRLREGCGSGTGADYKPYIEVRDFYSQGRRLRARSTRFKRPIHYFSNLEAAGGYARIAIVPVITRSIAKSSLPGFIDGVRVCSVADLYGQRGDRKFNLKIKPMRPLKSIDRISLFVAAILEPAKAGGMSEADATSVYNGLMRSYSNMQERNPAFIDLLFENAEKAINTTHISNDRS